MGASGGWGDCNHPPPTPSVVPPRVAQGTTRTPLEGFGRGEGAPAGDHFLKKRGATSPHLSERHNLPLPQAGKKGAQQAAGPRGDKFHPKVDSGGVLDPRGGGAAPPPCAELEDTCKVIFQGGGRGTTTTPESWGSRGDRLTPDMVQGGVAEPRPVAGPGWRGAAAWGDQRRPPTDGRVLRGAG